jgi:hypothetical protein
MRALAPLLLAAGCVDGDLTGVDRAVVVHLVSIDDLGTGHYEVAEHQLPELDDLATLHGARIAFVGRPTLHFTGDLDTVTCGPFTVDPGALDLRVTVDHGVAIARDERSFAMLAAYHELSLVLARAEEVTGLAPDDFHAGPMPINFEPTLAVEGAREDGKTNAFYEPCSDSFGLLRPSQTLALDLAYNAQVLAHELGHAYFQRTFAAADGECAPDGTPEFPGRFSTEDDIAGLNEGFADIFSFVLLGTTAVLNDPLGSSHFTGQRAIAPTVPNYVFFSGPAFECEHDHYCLGTELARSLYDAFVADGHDPHDPDARAQLGRDVLAALPLLPAAMRSYGDLAPPGLEQVECKLSKQSSSAPQFLRALVENLPAARRPALCAAMRHHLAQRMPVIGACP